MFPFGKIPRAPGQTFAGADWPDDRLVIWAQNGDERAFRELVQRWEPRLYYYLRRLIEVEAEVWDILQNTWLAVFRHLTRLQDPRKFGSWLYRIAHDQAANWLEKEKRYLWEPNEHIEPIMDGQEVVGESAETADEVALLHQALLRLPVLHREVVTLFYLEDFSAGQIGEILGLPEGTIKSRLHNGRKKLLHEMKKLGYERAG